MYILIAILLLAACTQPGPIPAMVVADAQHTAYTQYIVLPPYASTEKLTQKLHISFGDAAVTNIEKRDDVHVLCLVKGDTVRKFYELSRKAFDVTAVKPDSLYTGKLQFTEEKGVYHLHS